MDIKEYISSGILESYVFGTASSQELQEVECMSHIYPEIKEELLALQDAIEKLAIKSKENPSPQLKQRILSQIVNEPQNGDGSTTKIVPIGSKNSNSRLLKGFVAASILLLVGLGAYTLFLRSDFDTANQKLSETQNALNTLQTNLDTLTQENTFVSDRLAFVRDENTTKVQLNGTDAHTNNLATIFWNKKSEKVLLDVQNLTEISASQSYQLWVLVDGIPHSMGVFNDELCAGNTPLAEMETTGLADAFAITLEPFGGSESPSLDQLLVIGTI